MSMQVINNIEFYITVILIVLGVVGYIGSKVRKSHLDNDPDYQKRQMERRLEEQRQEEENRQLEDAIINDSDYN